MFYPKDLFQRKGLLGITKLPILHLWKHILIVYTKKVATYRNGNWKNGQCKPFMTAKGKRGGATWFCNHCIFLNTNSYPKNDEAQEMFFKDLVFYIFKAYLGHFSLPRTSSYLKVIVTPMSSNFLSFSNYSCWWSASYNDKKNHGLAYTFKPCICNYYFHKLWSLDVQR